MSLVCLVTGCSQPSGFGWLTAQELLRRDHTVVATMREISGRNAGAAAELGAAVEVAELDVTDDAGTSQLVVDVIERHGGIHALVNNAADVRHGALEDTSVQSLNEAFDANVLGPHRMIRAVLPHMRERGSGVIVQVSSINGFSVAPLFGSYSMSKHALEAYSEALAYEIGHFGVRVAIIEPSAFLTGLHERGAWEPGTDDGPYAPLKQRSWDGGLDEWVGTMENPNDVARAIADAIEDPATQLHVPVGRVAEESRKRARPMSDDALQAEALDHIDWKPRRQ